MRRLPAIAGFLFCAALFLAQPALAAESEGGLPQLDTSLFPEQFFWLVVTFSVLYVLMAFVALPGVQKTQDKRQVLIASELAAAEAANEAAKAMIAQYEKALAEARAKAQATVSEIAAKTTQEFNERQALQQRELHKRLHDAEMNILAARNKAMGEAKAIAAELASVIVEKVAGLKVKA